MDAPLCRLCEKRHYGTCAGAVVPVKPRARKKSTGPKKKSKARKEAEKPVEPSIFANEFTGYDLDVFDKTIVLVMSGLMEKVADLEARVLELESRKRYMREYQRAKRAEEK